MPRVSKRYARVELNRAALNAIDLGLADGVARICDATVNNARVPDAAPFGKGLITRGGFIVFLDGRQIAGTASRPSREWASAHGVVAFAGWGFPGRFQELGTINQPARPFVTPSYEREVEQREAHMRPAMAYRLRSVP